MPAVIAVDFDGTIVEHEYPGIGADVPGAFYWLQAFSAQGARLILWTMRSGPELDAAIAHCRSRAIEFWGINHNPEQGRWTASPKAYAQVYIDDAGIGCPLIANPDGRAMADWSIIGPSVNGIIDMYRARAS